MEAVLNEPYPPVKTIPRRPWSVAMRWHDLLFAHWPVDAAWLRPMIPKPLEVDTFDGQAWIGIVPFHMTGVRLRRLPSIFSLAFPELNVRTYVKRNGKSGVWFITLDASSRFGVCVARAWYRLPYYLAKLRVEIDGEKIAFKSRRVARGAPAAKFEARYQPVGPVFYPQPGTLEHWLTERYSLFAADTRGNIGRGDIHHAPWPLQSAEAEVTSNSMLTQIGLPTPSEPPLLHYAKQLDAVAWTVRWERS